MKEGMFDEKITDAIDRLNTVQDILSYLSDTRQENGLCSILDHCVSQLNDAKTDLLIIQEVEGR